MNVLALILALEQKGMEAADILDVVKAMAHAQPVQAPIRSAAAERQARYRERKAESITRDVTCDVTRDVTTAFDPLPPDAPPLSSPEPPTNTPPLTPQPKSQSAREREGEQMLLSAGMTEETLSDWKRVRKAKDGGPVTVRVAEGFLRECRKADVSAEFAGRTCCEKGWRGFEADWLNKPQQRAGPARQAPLRGSAAIADALTRITTDAPDNHTIPFGVAGFLPSR